MTGDNATTGMWERCDPQWTDGPARGRSHTAAPGVNAYITAVHRRRRPGRYDVDGGKTTLLSPVFDLTDLRRGGWSPTTAGIPTTPAPSPARTTGWST